MYLTIFSYFLMNESNVLISHLHHPKKFSLKTDSESLNIIFLMAVMKSSR